MKPESIDHMIKTNHKVKTFGKLYKDTELSGIETLEIWDKCNDCDFKTRLDVKQRAKRKYL